MIDPGNRHTGVLWLTINDKEQTIAYRELYLSKINSHELCEEIKRLNTENGDNINAYYIDPQGRVVGSALQNSVDISQQFMDEGIVACDWP